MFKKNKKTMAVIAVISASILCIAGITLAYLSTSASTGNKFTFGSVAISISEDDFPVIGEKYDGGDEWDGNGVDSSGKVTDEDENTVPDTNDLMVPYEVILKNPSVTNTGVNDAIVFIRITVPAEVISLVDTDSKKQDEEISDLFMFKTSDVDANTYYFESSDTTSQYYLDYINYFNTTATSATDGYWIELDYSDLDLFANDSLTRLVQYDNSDYDESEDYDEDTNYYTINKEGVGKTYIFAYSNVLASGETTETLFDKIQNKKYGSAEIDADEIETVLVESFTIQADDIFDSDGDYIDAAYFDQETLTYIFQSYLNQNPSDEQTLCSYQTYAERVSLLGY